MGRDEIVTLRGLHSNPNQFITPNGAAKTALNVWFARPGMVQQRRGFSRWSQTLTYAVKKLFAFSSALVAHNGGNQLYSISSAGVLTQISGSCSAPSSTTGVKVRACVSGKQMYLALADAPGRVITAQNNGLQTAGGLVAPGFDNMGVTTPLSDTGGFLADGYSAAYRYELVRYGADGREIVGPVSGRLVVSNVTGVGGYAAGVAKNYTVRALLPPDATQSDVIRIYRSATKVAGQALDDDCKLVYEKQLKQLDITNGYVEQKDITPDALRGDFIYTSPNAAEGISQNNELPPGCVEIAAHKGRVWYAGTIQRARFEFQILAVGGTEGIQNGDTLKINGGAITLTATTGAVGANQYLLVTGGTASYNIEQTALNLVSAINKSASNTIVWARYISGPNDTPGKMLLLSRLPSGSGYNVFVGAGSKRDCWNPTMQPGEHIVNLQRTANVVRATVTSGSQSFKVGEQVLIQGGTGGGGSTFGNGPFTITAIGGGPPTTWFEYSENGINDTLNGRSATIYADDIASFIREVKLNRIYYSKFLEGDAVPWENWIEVGADDREIVAVVPQGETLQVWKQDGIYRIVGSDEQSFEVLEVDVNVKVLAREMVVPFQQRVVGLTDKGIMAVAESGAIDDIDFPIRNEVLSKITEQDNTDGDLVNLCFMVPYEAEDLLLVCWSGNKDIGSGLNAACNEAFVYNGQADEWTKWKFDTANAPGNGKTCGIMNPYDRKLYFGDTYLLSGSSTYVYQERKARTSADYRDTRGDNTNAAIPAQYAPVIQTGRAPGMYKQWNEVGLMFNGEQPLSLTVTDANEFGNGGSHTVSRNDSQYGNRIWPHCMNGRLIILTIEHNTIDEGFELAGVLLAYEVLGLAVQK